MSLDPELVRQAIERNDAVGVRALLRYATESDRRACAKALRPLLAGPDFRQLATIHVLSPEQLAEGFPGVLRLRRTEAARPVRIGSVLVDARPQAGQAGRHQPGPMSTSTRRRCPSRSD